MYSTATVSRLGRILIGCCLAAFLGCADGVASASIEERPSDMPVRSLSSKSWTTIFRVGGTLEDSTLQGPMRPAADAEGLYILDFFAKNVQRYDHTGRHLWTYGRSGSGPDEFAEPRDLKSDAAGRAWVLDPGNSRITVLDKGGNAVMRIPLSGSGSMPQALVPLAGDEAMLIVPDPAAPLVRITSDGEIRERTAFPWAGFANFDYLATQLAAAKDRDSGQWVAAFQAGDGFFAFNGPQWTGYRGWFVEPVAFPEIVKIRSGGTVRTRAAQRPTFSARSISLSPERLYVLFGGRTQHRDRVVDTYALTDGSYTGSFLLPSRVSEIAWHDGGLYIVREDPYPELALWRPQGARLR